MSAMITRIQPDTEKRMGFHVTRKHICFYIKSQDISDKPEKQSISDHTLRDEIERKGKRKYEDTSLIVHNLPNDQKRQKY